MKTAFIAAFAALTLGPLTAQALDANDIASMDQVIAGMRAQLPIQMAANMWLIDIRRDGANLFYVMKARGKAPATPEWRENYVTSVCAKQWEALKSGWKFRDSVVDENGNVLAVMFVDKNMCPPR